MSENGTSNSNAVLESTSTSTEKLLKRKVGDVLFAARFPANVLSMLTTTTNRTSSVDSCASVATLDSHGSPLTQTPLSGVQGISVNPKTGGKKRTKPLRYDLIPVAPMAEVALLYGLGARLYESRNWERGYDWSLSYAALQRHLHMFWGGEEWDVDGAHHLAAVIFHACALMEFTRTHPELDDRGASVRNADGND
jgi:hypothetical protein